MGNTELKNAAKDSFEANPKVDQLHVTSDGMCFEKTDADNDMGLHHAMNHARSLTEKDIIVITRSEVFGERKPKQTPDEKIVQINECKTEEELMAIEIANNEPKKVKDALAAKLAEFKK